MTNQTTTAKEQTYSVYLNFSLVNSSTGDVPEHGTYGNGAFIDIQDWKSKPFTDLGIAIAEGCAAIKAKADEYNAPRKRLKAYDINAYIRLQGDAWLQGEEFLNLHLEADGSISQKNIRIYKGMLSSFNIKTIEGEAAVTICPANKQYQVCEYVLKRFRSRYVIKAEEPVTTLPNTGLPVTNEVTTIEAIDSQAAYDDAAYEVQDLKERIAQVEHAIEAYEVGEVVCILEPHLATLITQLEEAESLVAQLETALVAA